MEWCIDRTNAKHLIQKEAVTIEWISDWAGGIIVAVVIGAVMTAFA